MPLKNVAPVLFRRHDDEAAFERLYERNVEGVYRYALGMLGEAADAEDVTQTTFLNAYRAYKSGTRPDKPHSWLIAIAHNVCRQRFRQAQRRPREVAFDERIGDPETLEPAAPSAEDLRRALSQLPPNQRSALVMRELEGCSYNEIAGVLGVSVSALETLLFRARRSLREQLEEQLTCREATLAIDKQLDGRLAHGERRALRAHLRACPECNSLAQSQRAQRRALKALVIVPVPLTIAHWAAPSGASAATGAGGLAVAGGASGAGAGAGASTAMVGGVAAKVAAVVVAGVVLSGGIYEGVKDLARGGRANAAVSPNRPDAQARPSSRTSSDAKVKAKGMEAVAAHTRKRAAAARHAAKRPASNDAGTASRGGTAKPAGHTVDATAPTDATGSPEQSTSSHASDSASAASTSIASNGSGPQAAPGTQAVVHSQAPAHSQAAQHSQAAGHAKAPAHSKAAPHSQSGSQSPPDASTPPASDPGNSANAPGHANDPPGNSGNAPGQTTPPGNSASAPGHANDPPGNSGDSNGKGH